MNAFNENDVKAVVELVRNALEAPNLSVSETFLMKDWTSHQTLDIIFGAEELFSVQLSSAQMESVESIDTLLAAVEQARASASAA